MPRWLLGVSVLLIIGGLVLTTASETTGNILVLVGGLAQMWAGVAVWTNPSVSNLSHPRVWAAIFFALGVSFVVQSVLALV
jgi:hypothetical protein